MVFFQSRIANLVMTLINTADIDALLLKYRLDEDDEHFTVGEMTVRGSVRCLACESVVVYTQTTVLPSCQCCGGEWFVRLEEAPVQKELSKD